MQATEIRNIERLALINGITTIGGLMNFYQRMKQGNETIAETLTRHTREVLGLE